MNNKADNNIVSRFLLEPKFRVCRHLLLQLIILIISIDILFEAPNQINITFDAFYGWVGYFMFLNLIISVNITMLAPRLLLQNKLFYYLISVVILIVFSFFLMIVLQTYFYDMGEVHHKPTAIALFLNMASSILTICFVIVGTSALLVFKHWMGHSQRVNQLESATLESELKFLKSQINPHFLFNMLNNANIMVDEDPNLASQILVKLDDLLKYQMNDSTREKVFLSADISFLIDFLDLERTRRDEFDYTIKKETDVSDVEISPLLFIPFVENAVKHSMDNNPSYVHITFKVQNNELIFVCKNSKPKNPLEKKEGGLGLVNIKRRLDLLYANNYLLKQTETEMSYMVNLTLNLTNQNH